ncbi:MAG: zinc-ribbon domain-containing protein, partial [Saprospiraceae bacterium]
MKLFKCDHCDQPIYFENYFCRQCNSSLGFDP